MVLSMKTNSLTIKTTIFLGLTLTSISPIMADLIRANDIVSPKVIYDKDSRTESRLYPDEKFRELRKAVAIRVQDYRLEQRNDGSGLIDFTKITLEEMAPDMCGTERYKQQYSLGNCTGFIVDEKTLVTAGHCMFSEVDCESYKWAFGFEDNTEVLKEENVYSCKKIISQSFEYNESKVSDYAVIELDRPVKGIKPLKMRKYGRPLIGTSLVVIGHPLGLPLKTADGARVSSLNEKERENILGSLKLRKNYLEANLDTYGGNSGSPVFNKRTGKVEGILIQGYEDFEWDEKEQCEKSINLKGGLFNSYEKIMRINKIPALK